MQKFKGAIFSQNHRRSQEGGQRSSEPPIEMPPMTKIRPKSRVFSFSVSFSIFAYNSTRVLQYLTINKFLRTGGPARPLNSIFLQPI